MQKKNTPRRITRKAAASEPSNKLRTWAAATACGVILLSGFFFAGRQHFSSMEYGIRNSTLRKQLEDLRAEKQRLLYTREVSLSPNEIKKAARNVGLFDPPAQPNTAPELASARRDSKPAPSTSVDVKPTVIKTGSAVPVAPLIDRTLAVVAATEKPQKRAR